MNMLEPRLGIPGQKPTGPVEIDWSHPMTEGLIFCHLDNRDLVSGKVARRGAGYTEKVYALHGSCPHFPGSSANEYLGYDSDFLTVITNQMSIFAVYIPDLDTQAGADAGLCGVTEGNTEGFRWLRRNGGDTLRLRAFTGAGYNYDAVCNFSADVATTVSATYEGTGWLTYQDGDAVGSRVSDSGNINWGGMDELKVGAFKAGVADDSAHAALPILAIWDRCLSSAENLLIARDPYQFLKPAGQRLKTPALAITTPPTANIAGVRVPDPKWEEPGLLVPGQKPTGPVTIDWDNPLTQHLMFFVVPGISDVDLVTGRVPTAKVGTWSYVDGGVKFPTSSYWEYGVYPDLGYGSGSAMIMADLDATEGLAVALSYAQSSSGNRYVSLIKTTDGNITFSFRCDENSVFSASADPGTNKGVFVGMAGAVLESDGAIRARVYYQNEQIAYRLINPNDNWVATQDRMTIGASRDSSPGYSSGGVVKMVAMFYRPLSYEGCKSLSMDPYQFLIPA